MGSLRTFKYNGEMISMNLIERRRKIPRDSSRRSEGGANLIGDIKKYRGRRKHGERLSPRRALLRSRELGIWFLTFATSFASFARSCLHDLRSSESTNEDGAIVNSTI